jgi:hypothetical protein
MDVLLTLPEGLGVSCNRESLLNREEFDRLHGCVQLLLAPPEARSAAEEGFLRGWIDGFAGASHFAKDATAAGFRGGDFRKTLAALRKLLKDASERATVYKVLFLAATHSSRDVDVLAALMAEARERLELDGLLSLLVSDRIAAALPQFAYDPDAASAVEKEAIVALSCILLNADKVKHVQETIVFRTVLASLGVTDLRSERLNELVRKGAGQLIALLSPPRARLALMNVLRIAVADRFIKPQEAAFVKAIAAAAQLGEEELALFLRHVGIELGRVIEL